MAVGLGNVGSGAHQPSDLGEFTQRYLERIAQAGRYHPSGRLAGSYGHATGEVRAALGKASGLTIRSAL